MILKDQKTNDQIETDIIKGKETIVSDERMKYFAKFKNYANISQDLSFDDFCSLGEEEIEMLDDFINNTKNVEEIDDELLV